MEETNRITDIIMKRIPVAADRLAYQYLCDRFWANDVIYSKFHSPHFRVGDHAYEAKLSRGGTVVFTDNQLKELDTHDHVLILVYENAGPRTTPNLTVVLSEIGSLPAYVGGFKFIAVSYKHKQAQITEDRVNQIISGEASLCSIREAASILSVSDETVRRYVKSNKLDAIRVDSTWRVDTGSLIRLKQAMNGTR